MLFILFGISTAVLSGISIKKAANIARQDSNKDMANTFELQANFTGNFEGTIPENLIDKVSKVEGVKNYDAAIQGAGLDLENVPEFLKSFKPLNYRPLESYDDTYKIYKYIDICDIQILITPTDRLTSLQEKYKLASPILEYLDSENEEDIEKFAKFLEMVKNLKIDDIEEIETEQELLKDKIPFEVKYKNNFIWQIYYSDYCNKYFMLVPTREANNPELFYILKQQIQCNKEKGQRKIFVPISNMEYSERYLKKTEINDIENYLWYFTKQWPNIYEVYDNDENLEVQILGQVDVYEKC